MTYELPVLTSRAGVLQVYSCLQVMCTPGVFSQCEPICGSPGQYVVDPVDCSKYYYCFDISSPSDTPYSCPDGEIFDPSYASSGSMCKFDDGTCDATCVPECRFYCDGHHVYVADHKDCGVYYSCLDPDGMNNPLTCSPSTPFFNSNEGKCTADERFCCGDCYPYCFIRNKEIADPTDCTKFYLCVTVGPVDSGGNAHLQCPAGENFDPDLGTCYLNAPCVTPCPGGTPPYCQPSMTCTETGYFPACPDCQPDYFHCRYVGEVVYPDQCPDDRVFDTNPVYPYCVYPSACPSG